MENDAKTFALITSTKHFIDNPCGLVIRQRHYCLETDLKHSHDFHELVFVRSGTGLHETEKGQYRISRGDVYLIRPGDVHWYSHMKNLEIVNFLYQPERLYISLEKLRNNAVYRAFFENSQQYPEHLRFNNCLHFEGVVLDKLDALSRDIEVEWHLKQSGWDILLTTLFFQFIQILLRNAGLSNSEAYDEMLKIDCILQYIRNNCQKKLRPCDVARFSGMSIRSLQRFFNVTVGMSPEHYIMQTRLNCAAEMLHSSHKRISEISVECGFSDSNYFSKIFSKKFAMSPREYRNNVYVATDIEKANNSENKVFDDH